MNKNNFFISFFTGVFILQIYVLFCCVFVALWQRSKIGAILLVTVGPPLALSSVSWEEEARYRVLCSIKSEQEACVEWKAAAQNPTQLPR